MSKDGLKQLGGFELKLMRYLAAGSEMSVREVADDFGEKHGYALTTILTMMERLRTKGYLKRKKKDGINLYSSCVSQSDLIQGVVKGFVNNALEGSLSPLFVYIAEAQHVSDEEMEQLKALVTTLEDKEGEDA